MDNLMNFNGQYVVNGSAPNFPPDSNNNENGQQGVANNNGLYEAIQQQALFEAVNNQNQFTFAPENSNDQFQATNGFAEQVQGALNNQVYGGEPLNIQNFGGGPANNQGYVLGLVNNQGYVEGAANGQGFGEGTANLGYVGGAVNNQAYVGGAVNNQGYVGGVANNQGYVGGAVNNQGYVGGALNNQVYAGGAGDQAPEEAADNDQVESEELINAIGLSEGDVDVNDVGQNGSFIQSQETKNENVPNGEEGHDKGQNEGLQNNEKVEGANATNLAGSMAEIDKASAKEGEGTGAEQDGTATEAERDGTATEADQDGTATEAEQDGAITEAEQDGTTTKATRKKRKIKKEDKEYRLDCSAPPFEEILGLATDLLQTFSEQELTQVVDFMLRVKDGTQGEMNQNDPSFSPLSDGEEETPRKKRGRPRKNPEDDFNSTPGKRDASETPKKRGRKPKDPSERKSASTAVIMKKQDLKWLEKYNQLIQFKHQNGHTRVPVCYQFNTTLGSWVKRQRDLYDRKELQEDRVEKLKKIEFDWTSKVGETSGMSAKESWDFRYNQLVQYKMENGNCDVPQKHPSLGMWVKDQRKYYHKNTLSEERFHRLNQLGFSWDYGPKRSADIAHLKPDELWNHRFMQLIQYKQEYGDCNIPRRFPLNIPLGEWAHKQRGLNNRGKLLPDRVMKLNQVGFMWSKKY